MALLPTGSDKLLEISTIQRTWYFNIVPYI